MPAKLRSAIPWTRDEVLRLLRAWREVLREWPAVSDAQAQAERGVDEDVDALVFKRFVELSRGAANAPERRESSAAVKRRALLRTYRHAAAYNRERKRQVNSWFALTPEQQEESLVSQYRKGNVAKIDAEMFAILAEITRDVATHKARVADAVRLKSALWTKGEVWVLISAWRQVIESRPKSRDRNSNIAMMVFQQYLALSREGMPARSKRSVTSKLAKLVRLYRVINEFNERGAASNCGPHAVVVAGPSSPQASWFATSEADQAKYLAAMSKKLRGFTELDQDTFNAIEMVMKYEDSLLSSSGVASNSSSVKPSSRLQHRTDSVIDISSDGESESEASEWEMLPVTSSSHGESQYDHRGRASRDGHRQVGHSESAAQLQAASASSRYESAIARMVASSDSSGPESSKHARKRARIDSEQQQQQQFSDIQTQTFMDLLGKLKRERKADKAERRKERQERKELTQLIAQEREERERDREEQQKERQEWMIERDKLKLKLKRMRERYRSAAKRLKASLG